jgi:putative transposase
VYDIVRRIAPALLTLAHEGSKAYRQKYELIHRREASASNEMWQTDHTLLDIVLLDEKQQQQRPWLTTIIDDYSRESGG